MTATRRDWRVKIRKGDTLWTNATYDTKRAAWWESMGIMVAYMAEGGPGKNPFRRRVNFPGRPTHGHLPENDNHGGRPTGLPDPRKLPDGASPTGPVDILDFKYTLGDLSLSGQSGLPPVVQRGQPLTFRNADDGRKIYHSITSCKAPCNRSTGIAYPIADGQVQFESDTLGSAVPPATGRARVEDAGRARPGHLRLLLPHPPVHARGLPGQVAAPRLRFAPWRRVESPRPLRPPSRCRRSSRRRSRAPRRSAREAERDVTEAARRRVERVGERADELERRLDELLEGVREGVAALRAELAELRGGEAEEPAADAPRSPLRPRSTRS